MGDSFAHRTQVCTQSAHTHTNTHTMPTIPQLQNVSISQSFCMRNMRPECDVLEQGIREIRASITRKVKNGKCETQFIGIVNHFLALNHFWMIPHHQQQHTNTTFPPFIHLWQSPERRDRIFHGLCARKAPENEIDFSTKKEKRKTATPNAIERKEKLTLTPSRWPAFSHSLTRLHRKANYDISPLHFCTEKIPICISTNQNRGLISCPVKRFAWNSHRMRTNNNNQIIIICYVYYVFCTPSLSLSLYLSASLRLLSDGIWLLYL